MEVQRYQRTPTWLVGDAERNAVVEVLNVALASGRFDSLGDSAGLTGGLAELSRRQDAAFRARTYAELAAVVADIHDAVFLAVPLPVGERIPRGFKAPLNLAVEPGLTVRLNSLRLNVGVQPDWDNELPSDVQLRLTNGKQKPHDLRWSYDPQDNVLSLFELNPPKAMRYPPPAYDARGELTVVVPVGTAVQILNTPTFVHGVNGAVSADMNFESPYEFPPHLQIGRSTDVSLRLRGLGGAEVSGVQGTLDVELDDCNFSATALDVSTARISARNSYFCVQESHIGSLDLEMEGGRASYFGGLGQTGGLTGHGDFYGKDGVFIDRLARYHLASGPGATNNDWPMQPTQTGGELARPLPLPAPRIASAAEWWTSPSRARKAIAAAHAPVRPLSRS